jgi:hypothetical protein
LGELPGRGCWGWPLSGRLALGRGCLPGGLGLGFLAVFAEVNKRHLVGNDFDFGFLLAGGFIFPSFLFEAAFNVEAETFGEELAAVLGGLAKNGYVDEVCFFVLLVLIVIPYPVKS